MDALVGPYFALDRGVRVQQKMGTSVVHAQHGAATLAGTVTRDWGQGTVDLAVLEVIGSHSDLRVMVPVEQMQDRDVVRPPIGPERAEELLAALAEPVVLPDFSEVAWTAHFKSARAKVASGDPMQVMEVVAYVAAREEPSPAELTLADTARRMLVAELAAALQVDADVAARRLEEAEAAVVPVEA